MSSELFVFDTSEENVSRNGTCVECKRFFFVLEKPFFLRVRASYEMFEKMFLQLSDFYEDNHEIIFRLVD